MCRLSVTVRRRMNALTPKNGVKELLMLLTLTLAESTHAVSINKLGSDIVVTVRRRMNALTPKNGVKELLVLLTLTLAESNHALSINKLGSDIVAKTRVELRPITVNAFLYDVIRISAPVINAKAVYYIHKPNGDAMKLDIGTPKLKHIEKDMQPIVVRFGKQTKPIIHQENNYEAYAIRHTKELKRLEKNEFMIGPLSVEDHGNWVLSMYTKDFYDEWIEMFQVITVAILEFVPLTISKVSPNQSVSLVLDSKPTLDLGDTMLLGIAFPIPELESCELVDPRSTFDRFYDRTRVDMATCGFSVPNITLEDAGSWKIVAVGKIVYEGELYLNMAVNKTKTIVVID